MKVCGIVAEYNPFHNGHAYHIQQTKAYTNADIIVVIMSGNYVQRGELAILDKWTRAKEAILNGVDVVIELPSVFAIQSADYFGLGAMKIADALQLDAISFGLEYGNVQDIKMEANKRLSQPKDFSLSYQQQWNRESKLLQTPNNQLAIAYARGLKKLNSDIELVSVARIQTNHSDVTVPLYSQFASASAIRKAVYQHQSVSAVTSLSMSNILDKQYANQKVSQFVGETYFWELLQYRIVMSTIEQLQHIYEMREGIEYVLKRAIMIAQNYEQFLDLVSNKRWKKSRVKRLCCYIVLNMTSDRVKQIYQHKINALRLLAISQKGKQYIRKQRHVKLISQFKKSDMPLFEHQINSDKLYELMTNGAEQNFRRLVVQYDKGNSTV